MTVASYLFALALQIHEVHAGHGPSAPDEFSLFNHHLAGLFLILLAGIAFLERTALGQRRGVQYLWPLPLIGLGIYLLLRSDGEITWRFASAQWLPDAEAVQHKLFALLAVAIGVIELLRRARKLKHPGWRYIFYGCLFLGGLFLLFHSGASHSHVVHRQHIGMGISAMGVSVARVLADNRSGDRWLGLYLLPGLILVLGLQLLFYFE